VLAIMFIANNEKRLSKKTNINQFPISFNKFYSLFHSEPPCSKSCRTFKITIFDFVVKFIFSFQISRRKNFKIGTKVLIP